MTSVGISKLDRNILFITIGFWAIYLFLTSLGTTFNSVVSHYIDLRSEYTLGEQLSKVYLLAIIQVSFIGYLSSRRPQIVGLNTAFLLFGLYIYLAESNMISEKTQPFFGSILLAIVGYFLLRSQIWSGFVFMVLGVTSIASGSMLDRLGATDPGTLNIVSQSLYLLLKSFNYSEEQFDLLGIASLYLSTILSTRVSLANFLRKTNKLLVALIGIGTILIAFGNGLIHYQYRPGNTLYFGALIMSMAGFALLSFAINRVASAWIDLKNFSPAILYAFLFVFFVILPSTYGKVSDGSSLLLWLPTLCFLAWCLWQRHSIHNRSPQPTERPIHQLG